MGGPMVLWVMASAMAGGSPPGVAIEWKKGDARLAVSAPEGHKLAGDAPADLAVRWGEREVQAALLGTALADGLPLGDIRGAEVEGELAVVLCHQETGVCTPTTWTLSASVPGDRKGRLAVTVAAPEVEHEATLFGPDATAAAADAAFARAAQGDKLVLLDFSAVWCPPCMALAAEVLHADPVPEELAGFEVAVLDVDHDSSWTLKDRYAVGGYPTVVITDAEGTEKARLVGYPGRDEVLAWLASAGQSGDATRDPAEVAWALVQQGDTEAAEEWLAKAEESGADSVELRLARAGVSPTPEDLEWLLEHAPERAMDWAFSALELVEEHRELVQRVAGATVRAAEGDQLPDALYLAAKAEPDEATARLLYAAAAAAVRGQLGRHELLDKANADWLARLTELSGDLEGALAQLREASDRWAPEPTFDLALASMLNRHERHEEALRAADRALDRSWGDNRLRCAAAKAEALDGLGRSDEAAAFAAEVLDAHPAPEEGLDVRTHTYRERLAKWLKQD